MENGQRREKILILGGGIASLWTAYELTRTAELRARYDVTVLQMGWRLGGKLASGSDFEDHMRNREHGIHVWFGFYENAFGNIKEVYESLQKVYPNYRYKTYLDAFKPQSYTPIGSFSRGQYDWRSVDWPVHPGTPGDGADQPEPVDLILRVVQLLTHHLLGQSDTKGVSEKKPRRPSAWLRRIFDFTLKLFGRDRGPRHLSGRLDRLKGLMEDARARRAGLPYGLVKDIYRILKDIQWLYRIFFVRLARKDPDASPILSLIDVGLAGLCGLFNPRYGVMSDFNLNRINHLDFRQWLIKNGGNRRIVRRTSFIRALYDTPYAYENGSLKKPNFAAGAAMGFALRTGFMYKGSVLYLPQAGFGEAVIAPIYAVLKERGVKFQFFRKVKRLELTPDKNQIARVHVERQVDFKNGEYDPVRYRDDVQLLSWPTQPFWEQIVDGEKMKAAQVNWESNWNQYPVAGAETYQQGVDFDRVVLGISIGALQRLNDKDASICEELIQAEPRFRAMLNAGGVVATIGDQFWFRKSLAQLGWDQKPASVGGPEPIDVWIDMSQVLDTEDWKNVPDAPQSLQYLTGPLETELYKRPSSAANTPAEALALVTRVTEHWLKKFGTVNFPGAQTNGQFEWDALYDEKNARGPARLGAQYLRANVDPTECCDTSFTKSIAYRMKPNQSGFTNLTLTGTWTYTGINVTCVEAGTISGKMAARSICGSPRFIPGENFMNAQEAAP